MKLIVGLGNPGTEYRLTRHNAGFIFLDGLREAVSHDSMHIVGEWQLKDKFHAEISEIRSDKGIIAILVKPLTFMNNCGLAARTILDFYKGEINVETDLLVAFDDLDIKLGEYKFDRIKYPRTHKGVVSINNHLHTLDYNKLRIGAENRNAENRISGEDYVLQPFSQDELTVLVRQAIVPAVGRVRVLLQF